MSPTSGGVTMTALTIATPRPMRTTNASRPSGRRTTTGLSQLGQMAGAGVMSRVQNAQTLAVSGTADRQCGHSTVGTGSSALGP
jgi:hypothetical protein